MLVLPARVGKSGEREDCASENNVAALGRGDLSEGLRDYDRQTVRWMRKHLALAGPKASRDHDRR